MPSRISRRNLPADRATASGGSSERLACSWVWCLLSRQQEIGNVLYPLGVLLKHRHMACTCEFHQFGTGDALLKNVSIHLRNEAVVLTPNNQRGTRYPGQPPLKLRIVARIPGQRCQCRALAILIEEIVNVHLRWYEWERRHRIVETDCKYLLRIHREQISNRRSLDANTGGIRQYQLTNPFGVPDGKFRRHPAAKRMSNDSWFIKFQHVQQIAEIE